MLWPLADRPRLAPGQPGGTIPVRLIDDDLAASLASGGRLDILLSAAEVATSHDVDPDGAVGRALCLAVDPDLLVTVNAMTGGYVVSNSPDGPAQQPGTPTHSGSGQAAATTWLEPVARAGSPHLRGAAAVCASRSRCAAPGQQCRTERDRHRQHRRHRRPHFGRALHPRRHPAPRRPPDQRSGQPAQRRQQHGRNRRRRLGRPGSAVGRQRRAWRQCRHRTPAVVPSSGRRPVRPSRRCRAGRCWEQPHRTHLPGPVADRPACP